MTIEEEHRALRGRGEERARLDALLARAASGSSATLVLRGEAGAGKSALLDDAVHRADGFTIARVNGVESEVELAYAVLQQLCAPFVERVDSLPEPQRQALGTAFGFRSGAPPDRFLVGLAVLGLLADAAEAAPLLCVVDDAQWVDTASAQTLAFVARRIAAERIGMLFAVRQGDAGDTESDLFDDLPGLRVPGLADADAEALLEEATVGPLDDRVRSRIVAEARGNPLALLELARDPGAAELSFGSSPGDGRLAARIERGYAQRLERLPADTRRLLLIAAADPSGDVALLWRAAQRIGVPAAAVAPAQEAGLLELGAQVRFRHPLLRSAVVRAATDGERRAAHSALAEAVVGEGEADYRAWHRAQAALGVDGEIAAELEAAADRARARGGWAAAASFLTRSTELTPDPAARAGRALDAADAWMQAGGLERARSLFALAKAGPLRDVDAARAQLIAARLAFASTRGREAPALLLEAASRFETLDPATARDTYLDAFTAALFAGRLADGGGALREVATAIAQRSRPAVPSSACALLLDGFAQLVTSGYAAGVPLLRRALDALRADPLGDDDALRWLWPASRAARAVGDDRSWLELTARSVELARRTGTLTMLPIALTERFTVDLFVGDLPAALAVAAEADAVTEATGRGLSPHIAFLRAAWGGDESRARSLLDANRAEVSARGEGLWLAGTELTSSVFLNAFGRYDEALAVAERAATHPFELGLSTWVYPELIEAASRGEHPETGADALERLTEIARASETEWALGVLARCRALLSEGDDQEVLYRESLERLARTRIRVASARTQLVYGEWLRRQGRRVDAREQLRAALAFFQEVDMAGFAERARRELAATGETARARTVDTTNDLTEQEALIARLAAEGRSNPEIGAQLFISPRTVEWHLGKVFTKLGVTTRRELRSGAATSLQRGLAGV
ncbi:AAA family ATPase [Leifsonia shinshuensis]|uniref:AAA family ATPase n=1 Tax=Leifsonia shinshuensis TaxID=150026 RepID=UPI001F50C298|nr:LuxR family transcriptional regulator [Leifsonia shinshuensis]MCI0158852.1 AAA family ATPase [Leifsonia shinshuensis]